MSGSGVVAIGCDKRQANQAADEFGCLVLNAGETLTEMLADDETTQVDVHVGSASPLNRSLVADALAVAYFVVFVSTSALERFDKRGLSLWLSTF